MSLMKVASRISSTKQNLAEIKETEVLIKSLQVTLKAKNTEIEKTKLQMTELNKKYKHILLNYNAYKVKYYQIEEDNVKYIKLLRNQMEEFKKKVKRQEHLNDSLLQQLNEAKVKYQELHDKSIYQAEKIKTFESQLLQHRVDVDNVKRTYEMQLQSTQEKAHEEINNLRAEIKETKRELQGIIASKESIIEEKCKTITEQSYKMREIEKAFGRPITCVSRLTTETNKNNDDECQSESTYKHLYTNDSALCNTSAGKYLTTKSNRKRRLVLSPSLSPSNVINLDNEDNDYDNNAESDNSSGSILQPYRANSNLFSINRITSSNPSSKPSTPINTSEVFDMVKRSKK